MLGSTVYAPTDDVTVVEGCIDVVAASSAGEVDEDVDTTVGEGSAERLEDSEALKGELDRGWGRRNC